MDIMFFQIANIVVSWRSLYRYLAMFQNPENREILHSNKLSLKETLKSGELWLSSSLWMQVLVSLATQAVLTLEQTSWKKITNKWLRLSSYQKPWCFDGDSASTDLSLPFNKMVSWILLTASLTFKLDTNQNTRKDKNYCFIIPGTSFSGPVTIRVRAMTCHSIHQR